MGFGMRFLGNIRVNCQAHIKTAAQPYLELVVLGERHETVIIRIIAMDIYGRAIH